ncbi:MAG: hypothetical protein U5R06_12110 [candidate division KSB1 bacterium]|nr:hypothetical protein [candidate division KSB1 bacterium]
MQHLKAFILSEGDRYQDLLLGSQDIHPRKAPGSPEDGLDGWSFMMRTIEKDFCLLYFENQAVTPDLSGFKPETTYSFQWYDPLTGDWKKIHPLNTDKQGNLQIPVFPNRETVSKRDWAAKIIQQ